MAWERESTPRTGLPGLVSNNNPESLPRTKDSSGEAYVGIPKGGRTGEVPVGIRALDDPVCGPNDDDGRLYCLDVLPYPGRALAAEWTPSPTATTARAASPIAAPACVNAVERGVGGSRRGAWYLRSPGVDTPGHHDRGAHPENDQFSGCHYSHGMRPSKALECL